jgi:hypothetical protein
MDSISEKKFDRQKSLLLGLLHNCLFSIPAKECCLLSQLRNDLTLEEKYKYVMELSSEEIHNLLEQHEECYQKRIFNTMHG